MSRDVKGLTAVADEIKLSLVTDGTVTKAAIVQYDFEGYVRTFGVGVARRRKGDPRDTRLGTLIATQRAFQDAADSFADLIKSMGVDAG